MLLSGVKGGKLIFMEMEKAPPTRTGHTLNPEDVSKGAF